MRALRYLTIVMLCACNSILGIPTATAIDGGTPDTPPDPNMVHGMAIDTYWQSTTHTMMPRDLSTWQFAGLVPNTASPGGFDVFPGTGTASGTFQIPGVPDGVTFYLKVTNPTGKVSYRVVNARTFDIGIDVLGRPNAPLTTQTSNLVLNIDNMQAYQDTDFFEVFCINNGGAVFGFMFSAGAANVPAVGAVMLTNMTFDWSQPYGAGSLRNPVMDGDVGDTLAVIQESSVTLTSGVVVQTMARLYSEKFNQPDGTTHTINATFTQPPSTLTLNPTIKRSLFEAHRAEVNPMTRAQVDGDYSYGDSLLPSPDGHGQYGSTLDLMVSSLVAGTGDIPFGMVSYPDPFPSTWEHLRIARFNMAVRFSVDGGAMTGLNRGFASNRNLDFAPPTVLVDVVQPTVTPPLTPTVNGVNAFTGGNITAGGAATVAWTAPAMGTPVRYTVEIIRAYNDTGKTKFASEATLFTTDMRAVIPGERFVAGSHYIFVVTAESALDSANADYAPMISNVWTAM